MSAARAPDALRSLAALVRTGMSMRTAVAAWPSNCPDDLRGQLNDVRRRVALGEPPARAVAALTPLLGDDAGAVAAAIAVHEASGCDAARLLDSIATRIERRAALATSASNATAGTKLSGRIVSGLPLTILPLVPAAGVSVLDRRGSLLLLCGGSLLLAGAAWIKRLLPQRPEEDAVAELAELVASVLEAGVPLGPALGMAVHAAGPLKPELHCCERRVRLGAPWSASLKGSDDEGLRRLGDVLLSAERLGSPVSVALRAFADQRAAATEAEFDRAARRAPVLMIVPLTVCILPGYVLLAIGPVLRGVSLL